MTWGGENLPRTGASGWGDPDPTSAEEAMRPTKQESQLGQLLLYLLGAQAKRLQAICCRQERPTPVLGLFPDNLNVGNNCVWAYIILLTCGSESSLVRHRTVLISTSGIFPVYLLKPWVNLYILYTCPNLM